MNNEFRKTSNKDQTVYTLESATSGGTSSGSIASVSTPLGGMQRRNPPGDNILAQEADKKKIPSSTPRNFVAKNAKTGGAGAHKDKKKELKQGTVKHKKPYMEALQTQLDQLKSKLAEVSDATKASYKEKAKAEVDDLTPHAKKGEYKDIAQRIISRRKKGIDKVTSQGVAEGVAETMPMWDAQKVLNHYGADYFKTTHDTLYFSKYRKQFSIDRIRDDDSASAGSVNLSDLNAMVRKLRDMRVPLSPFGEGVVEGFNGEYDDEAGMAHTNLLTSARAVIGLLKTIDDKDNLPEWAQEKIAKAEMMLVGVWDYLQSQKAMGNDPQQGVEEGSLKEGKGLEGELARFLKSNGFKGPYRLGKLPKWAAELSEFDKTVLIMVQGDDVEYDEFVVDIGYGILYWGAEGGMTKMTEKAIVNHIKLGQQGVAEGSLNEGQYEMMMRNGQVKKFIAKDDADAKRIAAGHGAKSVIKLRGGVPAGKVAEQGVAEGEKTMSRAAKGNEKYGKDGMKALAKAGRDGASEKKLDAIRDRHDNYNEEWSQKYKSSINCSHPKGFSQKAHCAGKNKHNESIAMEMVCEDCGMCETHGDLNEIKKGAKDSNGYTKCWSGYHAAGTKKSATTGKQVRNCVPNEDIEESDEYFNMLERSVSQAQHNLMVGVANNPQFAQQVKVKQQVGQEFAKADTGRDISKLPMRVTKKK